MNNRKPNQPKWKRELVNPFLWKPPGMAAPRRNSQVSPYLCLPPSLFPFFHPTLSSFSSPSSSSCLIFLSVDFVTRQLCVPACKSLRKGAEEEPKVGLFARGFRWHHLLTSQVATHCGQETHRCCKSAWLVAREWWRVCRLHFWQTFCSLIDSLWLSPCVLQIIANCPVGFLLHTEGHVKSDFPLVAFITLINILTPTLERRVRTHTMSMNMLGVPTRWGAGVLRLCPKLFYVMKPPATVVGCHETSWYTCRMNIITSLRPKDF